MKSLRFSNAVLCDFVARGHMNKYNLVNVFSGSIVVTELPATLGFGIYIEMIGQESQPDHFELEIQFGDSRLAQFKAETPTMKVSEVGIIAIPRFEFLAEKEGALQVFVKGTGFRRTLALEKQLTQGPMPSIV